MISKKEGPPKAWEISLSKILNVMLTIAKLITLFYFITFIIATPIVWALVLLCGLLYLAIYFAHMNIQLLLSRVSDNNNNTSTE